MTSKQGLIIHLMGFHKSGKKTLCDILVGKLSELTNKNITYIDNDIKKKLSYGLKHNINDRKEQIERIGYIGNEIINNGGLVIFYSNYPFYKERELIKENAIQNGNMCINIFLDTPLSVCKNRDTEGIYILAENKKITNIPGIDEVYEHPNDFDIILSDDLYTNIEIILKHIKDYI
jgi:sulfate adenylyltransferase